LAGAFVTFGVLLSVLLSAGVQPEGVTLLIHRPGLREALAACRAGDTLVVTKLDRLARSVPDARDLVAELTARGVRLQFGGSVQDPTDPVGRLHRSGQKNPSELAELFGVGRSTVYRALQRAAPVG
jgi:DNA invertase Pin-like site-specific DNA recombinase